MADTVGIVTRRVESQPVAEFLARASSQPCALLVEGEAGIGKTTFLLSVLEQARQQGFQVLSTRCAAVETSLAYAALADLLHTVDTFAWSSLPDPQRLAIDRILLRVTDNAIPTDQRAVAAGFIAVIENLAERQPVLLAVDDMQWLDPSSAAVIAFAARRFSTPVGVVGTVRLESDTGSTSWLQASRPDLLQRIQLPPMALGELHHVVSERLGESLSRPVIVQIHEISGGNPFYALELARAIDTARPRVVEPLPRTLSDVVQTRLGSLDEGLQQVLLAVACSAKPTVELLSAVLEIQPDEVSGFLDEAEDKQIVALDGHRVRFSHPLLGHGVYTDAPAPQRRDMHRRIAQHTDEPELRARHLALAATSADPSTLETLDAAAEMARTRGAPAAAAELVELAIGLGGDTPERWITSATHHFNAGDAARARTRLQETIDRSRPGRLRAEALRLLGVWSLLDGSSRDAAGLLERALGEAEGALALLVQILVPLAFALINVGEYDRAETSAEEAVDSATRLGDPALLSQALGMRVLVQFLLGHGFDEDSLDRALELEDPREPVSGLVSPTVQRAELLAGTGRLDEARKEFLAIRAQHLDHGEESELTLVAFHRGLSEIWQGNFAEAELIADDAVERALQLDRHLPLAVALMIRAAVAAYTGNELDARRDATEASEILARCDSPNLVAVWPLTTLGFLNVSLGRYDDALTILEPLVRAVEKAPAATEIFMTPFLPDAIEALTHLGRTDEAARLAELLERNGRRLDRPWMTALGARCRGMALAATGNIDEANQALQEALAEHARLPMPFELARTRLVLGQIQRRQRQKGIAFATLQQALDAFESLGATLWADRARAEMSRVKVAQYGSGDLTAAERRVAELAASGMTNREVAATLFVSPKTVDTNLTRVYRKLGIHTRAELGQRMGSRT